MFSAHSAVREKSQRWEESERNEEERRESERGSGCQRRVGTQRKKSKTVTEWEKRSGGCGRFPIPLFFCAFRKNGDGEKIKSPKRFFQLMQKKDLLCNCGRWKHFGWISWTCRTAVLRRRRLSGFFQKCAKTWLVAKRYMLTDEEAKILLGLIHEKISLTLISTCQAVRCQGDSLYCSSSTLFCSPVMVHCHCCPLLTKLVQFFRLTTWWKHTFLFFVFLANLQNIGFKLRQKNRRVEEKRLKKEGREEASKEAMQGGTKTMENLMEKWEAPVFRRFRALIFHLPVFLLFFFVVFFRRGRSSAPKRLRISSCLLTFPLIRRRHEKTAGRGGEESRKVLKTRSELMRHRRCGGSINRRVFHFQDRGPTLIWRIYFSLWRRKKKSLSAALF